MQYAIAFTTFIAGAMAGSACSAAAPAASSAASAPADNGYFGVVSSRSGSAIHFQTLNARSGKFYLGGPGPTTYCPADSIGASNCPAGNTTVLSGGDNTLGLGVVVPGGQQVYVASNGSLEYTQAHSAAIPTGATQTGFSREAPSGGNTFGYLHFDTGFVACPAGEGQGYQVFGQVADAKFADDCLGFDALTGMFCPCSFCALERKKKRI